MSFFQIPPIREIALGTALLLYITNVFVFANLIGQPASVASLTDCPGGLASPSASETWTTCPKAADKTTARRAFTDDNNPATSIAKVPDALDKINSKASRLKSPSKLKPGSIIDSTTADYVVASNLVGSQMKTLQSLHRGFQALKTKEMETKPTWNKKIAPFTKSGNKKKAQFMTTFRLNVADAGAINLVSNMRSVANATMAARIFITFLKIPSYHGPAILQTRLTVEQVQRIIHIGNGYAPVPEVLTPRDLTVNIMEGHGFKEKLTQEDVIQSQFNCMFATPGLTKTGIARYPDGYLPNELYTLVIYSETSRFVTPLTSNNAPSVMWGEAHFRVLGYTKRNKNNPKDEDPDVIYVEQV